MYILNRNESTGNVDMVNTGLIGFPYSHFSG